MYVKASVLKSHAGRIRDLSILSACWPKGRCRLHSWLRLQGDCPNGKLDLPTSRAQFFFHEREARAVDFFGTGNEK